MKSKRTVTFAILNYDDASNLIGRSKIYKNEYKACLDLKAIDKVQFKIYEMGDEGIIFTECKLDESDSNVNQKLKKTLIHSHLSGKG